MQHIELSSLSIMFLLPSGQKKNVVVTYLPKFFIQIGRSGHCRGISFFMVHAQVLVDKLSTLNKFDHLIQLPKYIKLPPL